LKAFSSLAGGVARQGETCGAIIGAMAALNLVIGREKIKDSQTYQAAMIKAIELHSQFKEELKQQFGFTDEIKNSTCRYIQEKIYGRGFIMTDPKEREAFEAAGGHSEKGCPKVCAVAAEVAARELSEFLTQSVQS
jgi:hypothetical protein